MLANSEKPMGVTDPFDIGLLSKIKFPFKIIPMNQLIKNNAVNDFFNPDFLSVAIKVDD